jgi:alpha-D-ribose 1-methylphosphonate 5-triphosphate synthase subunit PhnG
MKGTHHIVRVNVSNNSALKFLGEVSLTRFVFKPDAQLTQCQKVDVTYVMGSSHRHAQLAAVADALLQEPALHAH